MKNMLLNAFQAEVIAADRWRLFAATDEILLPSGCQLAKQEDGTYLLKGYSADGADVDKAISVNAWSLKTPA